MFGATPLVCNERSRLYSLDPGLTWLLPPAGVPPNRTLDQKTKPRSCPPCANGAQRHPCAHLYDLAISSRYFRLPPHSRRIETLVPLTAVSSEQLRQAAERWQDLLANTPRPRIALLVGGTSYACRFDEETAYRLGVEVRSFAEAMGGTVFAATSRRTGPQATAALKKGLGHCCYLHEWQPDQSENPYLAYHTLANILIVTGRVNRC